MTKHPYLKEILKTTAKVALIAGVTLVAAPAAFGFAAGFFNMMLAGQIAGGVTLGVGALITAKTLIKDIVTMHGRVKKQQQEEQMQERLSRLQEELEKLREEHKRSAERQAPKELEQKPDPERTTKIAGHKRPKINLDFLRRLVRDKREGRRAA